MVVAVQPGVSTDGGTDETGRSMLQLLHSLPGESEVAAGGGGDQQEVGSADRLGLAQQYGLPLSEQDSPQRHQHVQLLPGQPVHVCTQAPSGSIIFPTLNTQ